MIKQKLLGILVLPLAFVLAPAQADVIGGYNVVAYAAYDLAAPTSFGVLGVRNETSFFDAANDTSVDSFVFASGGAAALTLTFAPGQLIDGAGADLVLFEVGNPAEAFSSLTVDGVIVSSLTPTWTGELITGLEADGEGKNLNALAIDIGALGLTSASTLVLGLSSPGADFALAGSLSAVPVPAAVWMFGSGLIGLVGIARRRRA